VICRFRVWAKAQAPRSASAAYRSLLDPRDSDSGRERPDNLLAAARIGIQQAGRRSFPTSSQLFRRGGPAPLRAPITPERVAAATVRGIERRSARIIVPGRWIPLSVLRGIVNPLSDRVIEHDAKFGQLVLELEQQASSHR
jgi:hypothetical protein